MGAEDDGMEWRHLNCLHTLCFYKLPKLESLSAVLQRVTTLKNLTISDCPNLICLPECISEFTSLEYLQFTRCAPNLTSLPDILMSSIAPLLGTHSILSNFYFVTDNMKGKKM